MNFSIGGGPDDDLPCHCEGCNWMANGYQLGIEGSIAVGQGLWVSRHVLYCVCVWHSSERISSPTWCQATPGPELQTPASWQQRRRQQQRLCSWPFSSPSACNRSVAGSSWERGMSGGVSGCSEDPGMWGVPESCLLWVPFQIDAGAEHCCEHSRMHKGRQ